MIRPIQIRNSDNNNHYHGSEDITELLEVYLALTEKQKKKFICFIRSQIAFSMQDTLNNQERSRLQNVQILLAR